MSDVCDLEMNTRSKCEGEVFRWVVVDSDENKDTYIQVCLCERHAGTVPIMQAIGLGTEVDSIRPSVEGRIFETRTLPQYAHLKKQ